MTFRKLMMLAGIGGLVYAHRKRGGQMTVDSFKQSGRDLVETARTRVQEAQAELQAANEQIATLTEERSSDAAAAR